MSRCFCLVLALDKRPSFLKWFFQGIKWKRKWFFYHRVLLRNLCLGTLVLALITNFCGLISLAWHRKLCLSCPSLSLIEYPSQLFIQIRPCLFLIHHEIFGLWLLLFLLALHPLIIATLCICLICLLRLCSARSFSSFKHGPFEQCISFLLIGTLCW